LHGKEYSLVAAAEIVAETVASSLVVGFDFCYDCYDGFADWQKKDE